ncbi:holin family protein [Mechercharimyces sp. CAU 1602]|uniref:phage holin family protein n=1 Tax=Mechercharimyces sp. CAU 1602 TaxID=2973933 RepID=UPI002162B3FA|nr:phage holin family protein [Mechercharimyces sp. CAU 1602]MCS1350329.1 phage holin family protein [Mechercharimyces sp. CAU 1602]
MASIDQLVYVKFLVGFGGAVASFMWGGWSEALTILAVFVSIDFLTGFAAAGREGRLSSRRGMRGISKKLLIFAFVAVAHLLDQFLGESHLLRDGAVAFYIANECLSIVENFGRMGLPIPPKVREAIEILRGKDDE